MPVSFGSMCFSENIMRPPCMWVSAGVLLCVCGLKSGCAHRPGKMFLNGV